MLNRKLVVGTRGSALALWQTDHVVEQLRAIVPGLDVRIRTIKTHGDIVRDLALSQVGGKGLFVKEIEAALLVGEIDLAVHSLKDMPTQLPGGLVLGAILQRADPRDALIIHESGESESTAEAGTELNRLPGAARVGTSSLRRRAQLLAARPDLQVLDLRGNVDTRLQKLSDGKYDAVVLAAAGLIRLGYGDRVTAYLPPEVMLPAVGQGALCIECRRDDGTAQALVAVLDHLPTRRATEAERALLHTLEGGCQVPIAAHGTVGDDGHLYLRGLVSSPDGTQVVRDSILGPAEEAAGLGTELADRLLALGAGDILEGMARGRHI